MKHPESKKPSKRLRKKLLMYFLGFSAIILGALWLMQMVFLDDLYKAIRTVGIEKSAEYICENINDGEIVALLDEVANQNDIRIEVYGTNSVPFTQIYSSVGNMDLSLEILPHRLISYYNETCNQGGKALFSEKIDSDFQGYLPKNESQDGVDLTCVRLMSNGKSEIMLVLRTRVTPIESTVTTMRFILIIITVLLVVLSVTMSVILSWKLSKPLKDINEKAKALAGEDYSVTFEGRGYREIEELNATLNVAARELGLASKLREELIANVSHDLRTPLTMIKGYAEVMRDIPGEMNEENLQAIVDESTRLSNLVNDLLDISKLQSGAVPVEKSEFSLTDCASDILSRFANLFQQQYTLSFDYQQSVSVYADKKRIEQVLYNLISNAVNYSGEKKIVKVTQRIMGDKVRLEVSDSGQGIEPEKLAHIWDRYYRVGSNHQRAVVGTGLGLSIVKEILDKHNSHFGVTSQTGVGSTFWFDLDIYSE